MYNFKGFKSHSPAVLGSGNVSNGLLAALHPLYQVQRREEGFDCRPTASEASSQIPRTS
jgi:hypothetical protein